MIKSAQYKRKKLLRERMYETRIDTANVNIAPVRKSIHEYRAQ